MKIQANVELLRDACECKAGDIVGVDVDTDYVESDADAVNEWVRQELESMFMRPFWDEDFNITNMADILEEITFEEFNVKVG